MKIKGNKTYLSAISTPRLGVSRKPEISSRLIVCISSTSMGMLLHASCNVYGCTNKMLTLLKFMFTSFLPARMFTTIFLYADFKSDVGF